MKYITAALTGGMLKIFNLNEMLPVYLVDVCHFVVTGDKYCLFVWVTGSWKINIVICVGNLRWGGDLHNFVNWPAKFRKKICSAKNCDTYWCVNECGCQYIYNCACFCHSNSAEWSRIKLTDINALVLHVRCKYVFGLYLIFKVVKIIYFKLL